VFQENYGESFDASGRLLRKLYFKEGLTQGTEEFRCGNDGLLQEIDYVGAYGTPASSRQNKLTFDNAVWIMAAAHQYSSSLDYSLILLEKEERML